MFIIKRLDFSKILFFGKEIFVKRQMQSKRFKFFQNLGLKDKFKFKSKSKSKISKIE